MFYEIYKDGVLINTIVGDEKFISAYCEKNGYTYVVKERPTPETSDEPTLDERVSDLETALAQTDETAIELFEAQAAQEEINAAQDDALIELYEMVGG